MSAISWLALALGIAGSLAAMVGMWEGSAAYRPQMAMGAILSGAGLVTMVVVRLVLR